MEREVRGLHGECRASDGKRNNKDMAIYKKVMRRQQSQHKIEKNVKLNFICLKQHVSNNKKKQKCD